jgi:hypothetical protein
MLMVNGTFKYNLVDVSFRMVTRYIGELSHLYNHEWGPAISPKVEMLITASSHRCNNTFTRKRRITDLLALRVGQMPSCAIVCIG